VGGGGDRRLALIRRRCPLAEVDAWFALSALESKPVLEPALLSSRVRGAGRKVLGIHILVVENDQGVTEALGEV
jgi:hypothetical protein